VWRTRVRSPWAWRTTPAPSRRSSTRNKKARYLYSVPHCPEPVFLNVYRAQESIPRNEFRQPM
jgi:hypothetical protein